MQLPGGSALGAAEVACGFGCPLVGAEVGCWLGSADGSLLACSRLIATRLSGCFLGHDGWVSSRAASSPDLPLQEPAKALAGR